VVLAFGVEDLALHVPAVADIHQAVAVLVHSSSCLMLVVVSVKVLRVWCTVTKIHGVSGWRRVIRWADVLAFLEFLIFLIARLTLILRILLDVRGTTLARNALERLFTICEVGELLGRFLKAAIRITISVALFMR